MCPPNPLPPADAVRTVRRPDGTFTYLTESTINLQTSALESTVVLLESAVTLIESAIVLQESAISLLEAIESNTDGIESALATLNAKDFATQTTLAALNAKVTAVNTGAVVVASSALPSGASTSANQTTEIGLLASIAAEDFATETTLASIAAASSSSLFTDFGSAGNLGKNVNDAFTLDNTGGHSSISFRVVPPTGGSFVFEGSADGDNWDTTTMRSTTLDEYIATGSATDIVIGSISALRKFRVRTTVAGTAAGTVKGRAQRDASTIESTEFSNRPDKIGATLITKAGQFTTAQTNTVVWTPAAGKRFYMTSYKISASGTTDANITVFDETNSSANWISPTALYDVSVNNSIIDTENLSIPYKSAVIGNSVRVTSSAAINFTITVRGYEAT